MLNFLKLLSEKTRFIVYSNPSVLSLLFEGNLSPYKINKNFMIDLLVRFLFTRCEESQTHSLVLL